jgi:hypothetical protein
LLIGAGVAIPLAMVSMSLNGVTGFMGLAFAGVVLLVLGCLFHE